MARSLAAALRVRPGEGPLASRLLGLMLVGMAGAAIGANGVESLFFARSGPELLPYLYLALGPLTFGVMATMGAIVSDHAVRFLVRLPLFLAVILLMARAILFLDADWFYPVLWLVMMVLWTCQVMGSWALAGAVSDTRQAKRLFPLYGAALIVGSVVGGLATGPLAALLHAENLTLVWAGGLAVMHLLARSVVAASAMVRPRRRRRRAGVFSELGEGFRDLWTWPLLRWMAVSLVLFAVLYFTVSVLFAQAATTRFPRADQLAGFLGLFMGIVNGGALLVSLLVANRLFARFGVPAMVLILAVVYLAGFAALALWSTFGVILVFRFVQMVWVNGVWAIGWQALFNVVPEERRARTRTFMDGGPLQLGVVFAGLLLILADRALPGGVLPYIGVGVAVLAVAAMWRARRAYGSALMEALRTGNPDVFRPDEAPFGGFRDDADAAGVVVAGAADPDPAVRRVSMEILADLDVPDAAGPLASGLGDPDPSVRAAAVRGLARANTDLDPLKALLDDPDPAVRAQAAGALLPDEDALETVARMSEDPRPQYRAGAMEALGRTPSGTERLIEGLGDHDPVVRAAAASTLASVHPAISVEPLTGALGDEDPGVRRAAAGAMARLGSPAEAALLRALSDPRVEEDALLALAAITAPPPEPLRGYARHQVERAAHYHRLEMMVGTDGDDRLALLAHAVRSRAVNHGLNAVRAMVRLTASPALPVAIENLASRHPAQRANALETLESVGQRELVRPLLAVWEPSTSGPADVAGAVSELLQDPDPWLRACAALAAASVQAGGLAESLTAMARSDADPIVRDAAASSLKGDGVKTLTTVPLLDRVLCLRKVPLFTELSPADLKHVAEVAEEHAYPDGEVVAEQGEAGEEMHIVVAGEVRVVVGGREVARRGPGEYVGEMAILAETTRMASLVCAGPVRTLSIERRAFERILRERPDVSLAVMRVLSDRLREAHAGSS
jgi:CRP/FNR family cyclic AMP-dependent transcriptional regulator